MMYRYDVSYPDPVNVSTLYGYLSLLFGLYGIVYEYRRSLVPVLDVAYDIVSLFCAGQNEKSIDQSSLPLLQQVYEYCE